MTTELDGIDGCKVDLTTVFRGNSEERLANSFLIGIVLNEKVCERKSRFHITSVSLWANFSHERNGRLFCPSLKSSLFEFTGIHSLAFIVVLVHDYTGDLDTLFLGKSSIVCCAKNEIVALRICDCGEGLV